MISIKFCTYYELIYLFPNRFSIEDNSQAYPAARTTAFFRSEESEGFYDRDRS